MSPVLDCRAQRLNRLLGGRMDTGQSQTWSPALRPPCLTKVCHPALGDQRNPDPLFQVLAIHTWVTSRGSVGPSVGSGASSRMSGSATENGTVEKPGTITNACRSGHPDRPNFWTCFGRSLLRNSPIHAATALL